VAAVLVVPVSRVNAPAMAGGRAVLVSVPLLREVPQHEQQAVWAEITPTLMPMVLPVRQTLETVVAVPKPAAAELVEPAVPALSS
jgi:hypothetical protein